MARLYVRRPEGQKDSGVTAHFDARGQPANHDTAGNRGHQSDPQASLNRQFSNHHAHKRRAHCAAERSGCLHQGRRNACVFALGNDLAKECEVRQ